MNVLRSAVACATFLFSYVPIAAAAENVVIVDVTGTWERVSAPGQSLTRYQKLAVKEKIRFLGKLRSA